jgi:hypothetical protein
MQSRRLILRTVGNYWVLHNPGTLEAPMIALAYEQVDPESLRGIERFMDNHREGR